MSSTAEAWTDANGAHVYGKIDVGSPGGHGWVDARAGLRDELHNMSDSTAYVDFGFHMDASLVDNGGAYSALYVDFYNYYGIYKDWTYFQDGGLPTKSAAVNDDYHVTVSVAPGGYYYWGMYVSLESGVQFGPCQTTCGGLDAPEAVTDASHTMADQR